MKRGTTHSLVLVLAIGSAIALGFSQSIRELPKTGSTASVRGLVKDDAGKPLRGVTVTAASSSKSVSRFTDQSGQYKISGLQPGQYVVSAATWGFSRQESSKDISGDVEISFQIMPKWDLRQLSTTDWLSFLPEDKDTLILEASCIGCHTLNKPASVRGRTAKEWATFLLTMGKLIDVPPLPEGRLVRISTILEKRFGPNSPLPNREQIRRPAISDAALQATFREYPIPTRCLTLCLTVDRQDNAWFTEIDFFSNRIGRFDIKTEKFQEYPAHVAKAEPHNIAAAQDGRVWTTMSHSNQLTVLDPKTGKMTDYTAPTPGKPHIVDVDSAGNVWYTDYGANKIVKFDPRVEKFQEFKVPAPATLRQESIVAVKALPGDPMPKTFENYGIGIDSHDKIWFCEFDLGKIARLDPITEKITEYDVPGISSLRGLAIDSEDNVWFANFLGHKLGKLTPKTGKMELFQPPTRHAAPYGVLVARDGYIWFTDAAGNQITSFNPKTQDFVEYPIPTLDPTTRFMGQDSTGKIWFAEYWASKIGSIDPGRTAQPAARMSGPPANVSLSKR